MAKVLVISGHPDLEASVANKAILDAFQKAEGLDIEIREVNTGIFDVSAEQMALLEADIVVWQFPFFWYALPSGMKAWVDNVFTYGFAFGAGGDRLWGKKLILSFTTGAPMKEYAIDGAMNYEIAAFIPPLRQTALYCGMSFEEPIITTGMHYIPGLSTEADRESIKARARMHSERLAKLCRSFG
ncbi:flavodoxin family protein [Asaia sp. W19]|uniref:NAD(P)H-dependent oxidoreductase n=1 Tax=unclassified Asaia TaxID=2685023 RepID=UPI000F8F5AF7|nr:NAD(P)H-dependent oxidoreductase [Asaia sp. W19]RUT25720.1 flavodoxin family protein [Asaia sp. W19]